MPELKFDYNNKDYELIASQEQINTSFLGEQSSNLDTYVRMSVYTITGDGRELGRILDYDDANGTPKQAIFYSTLNPNTLEINTSPFIDKLDAITVRPIGGDSNDFKIYRDVGSDGEPMDTNLYIKPNDIFDITDGATFYHADYIPDPRWAKNVNKTVKIDRHIFYSEKDI